MRLLLTAFAILFFTSSAAAKIFDKTAEIAGITVQYKVGLPNDYDPAKTYPAVLAFPPGSQGMDMVLTTLEQNWRVGWEKRGYIVIVPAAPLGRSFEAQGAKVFPGFLEKLLSDYKIRDKKFHMAGVSNGGISAFNVAANYPQYVRSVIALPGFLRNDTPERIAALSSVCIYLHVGELDEQWLERMQQQTTTFRSKGYSVRLTVEKGEGHNMRSLMAEQAARLFDEMEESRKGCGAKPGTGR
jgi:predicted peptidase